MLLGSPASAEGKRWFTGSDRVFVRQHEQFERIQEPDVHLQRALQAFAKGMKSLAADEIEKASAGFAYFAEREGGAQRNDLDFVSRALNKLADDTRRNRVDEITTLEDGFADAYRVLAGGPLTPPAPAPPE
ncbi:MAG: hypothetical protein ACHQ6V_13915 [Myxococcota bacterium]